MAERGRCVRRAVGSARCGAVLTVISGVKGEAQNGVIADLAEPDARRDASSGTVTCCGQELRGVRQIWDLSYGAPQPAALYVTSLQRGESWAS